MAKNKQPITAEAATAEEAAAAALAQPAESLGLSDEQLSAEAHGDNGAPLTAVPPAGRQGDNGRPFCSRHNCLMRATKTVQRVTHYACPVPGCDAKEKKARPQVPVPAEPMKCPDRQCEGKEHYLEVNAELSREANLHMHCPACGFNVKVTRPQFAGQVNRIRDRQVAEADDFGAR